MAVLTIIMHGCSGSSTAKSFQSIMEVKQVEEKRRALGEGNSHPFQIGQILPDSDEPQK